MKIRRIAAAVLIIVLAAAGGGAVFRWKKDKDALQQQLAWEQLRQDPALLCAQEEMIVPIDFTEWRKTNPDIYAWITVPGTNIDDPVLQSGVDNTYYLTHSATGETSAQGAIFSEDYNSKDFTDAHTVLYGQTAEDGTLFADLHKFGEESFFKEHNIIMIFTPDAVRKYRIFAAYLYDDRHLLQTYDCEDPAILRAYILQTLKQRNLYAQIDTETPPEPGDDTRLLTLSTGHSKGAEYRYLVQAVLEEEYNQYG